jgi:hypothetical protein
VAILATGVENGNLCGQLLAYRGGYPQRQAIC